MCSCSATNLKAAQTVRQVYSFLSQHSLILINWKERERRRRGTDRATEQENLPRQHKRKKGTPINQTDRSITPETASWLWPETASHLHLQALPNRAVIPFKAWHPLFEVFWSHVSHNNLLNMGKAARIFFTVRPRTHMKWWKYLWRKQTREKFKSCQRSHQCTTGQPNKISGCPMCHVHQVLMSQKWLFRVVISLVLFL